MKEFLTKRLDVAVVGEIQDPEAGLSHWKVQLRLWVTRQLDNYHDR
jgi:hypothetical protein